MLLLRVEQLPDLVIVAFFLSTLALVASTGKGTLAVGPSSATLVLMAEARAAIRPVGREGTTTGDGDREAPLIGTGMNRVDILPSAGRGGG